MPATLTPRRFTVDEYYRMAEAGILAPGERVELIEGEIVAMAAIGSRHAGCVNSLNRLLVRGLDERAVVSVQNPVRLSDMSEPEPDVAVLRPRADRYAEAHPGPPEVLLIIEVSDTTAAFDREVKGPLYARAGVQDFWLVDIDGDRVEVHRDPTPGAYRDIRRHGRGATLRPLAFPELDLPVNDILY